MYQKCDENGTWHVTYLCNVLFAISTEQLFLLNQESLGTVHLAQKYRLTVVSEAIYLANPAGKAIVFAQPAGMAIIFAHF